MVVDECPKCKETKEFEILKIEDGEDCWKIIIIKCPNCGFIKEEKIYC